MGASAFYVHAIGKTARDAFYAARDEARESIEEDDLGYSGTIAEKDSFRMIPDTAEQLLEQLKNEGDQSNIQRLQNAMKQNNPLVLAYAIGEILTNIDDPRITNKWGPAGCIAVTDIDFVFFGWASD